MNLGFVFCNLFCEKKFTEHILCVYYKNENENMACKTVPNGA